MWRKIYYNSRDIEFSQGDYFLAHPVYSVLFIYSSDRRQAQRDTEVDRWWKWGQKVWLPGNGFLPCFHCYSATPAYSLSLLIQVSVTRYAYTCIVSPPPSHHHQLNSSSITILQLYCFALLCLLFLVNHLYSLSLSPRSCSSKTWKTWNCSTWNCSSMTWTPSPDHDELSKQAKTLHCSVRQLEDQIPSSTGNITESQ